MYDLKKLWEKALNKESEQLFYVNGRAITAFQIKYEGNLMWLLISGNNSLESLLSEEEYEHFRYMNQDVPFMDF